MYCINYKNKKIIILYNMKINFIIFIVGILFIINGYAQQMSPSCDKGVEVKFVPRDIFDEISRSKPYTE